MLVPAILFKEQIIAEFQRIYFTEDMMYLTGCLEQWSPDISASPEEGKFDFAIVSNNKLIGYLSYRIDYYCEKRFRYVSGKTRGTGESCKYGFFNIENKKKRGKSN